MRVGLPVAACFAAFTGLASFATPASPADTQLDRAAVEHAIAIGRGPERAYQAFEEPYRLRLGGPTFVELEIVTEFRRVVLAARQRALVGDSTWGYEEALDALRPYRGRLTFILRVALPPQNVDYRLPAFDMVVYPPPGRGSGPLSALDVRRLPQYVAGQLAPPGSPVLGGLIEQSFDARALDPRGSCLVGLFAEGKEVQRVPVDLATVR